MYAKLHSASTLLHTATILFSLTPLTSATVCFPTYNWMNNFIYQNPCTAAGYLNAPCSNDPRLSVVRPVPANHTTYPVPGEPGAFPASPCVCNTVYYNMIQACSKCQGRLVGPWSVWQKNCDVKNATLYPRPVTGTMLPLWAHQNVLQSDFFNPIAAMALSGKKVPPYAFLSPKARIAVIVLSSIGGFLTLLAATMTCWRSCKRGQRRSVSEESSATNNDSDADDEDKEQQKGLLNASAPMGTSEASETAQAPYMDTSFAPQFQYNNGENLSGYTYQPPTEYKNSQTSQPTSYQ